MKKIIDFFKRKWVIQLIGIIALSLVLWFFGPLIAIGGNVPLETEVSRLIAILIIVVLWGANNLYTQVKASRANAQMVNELVDSKIAAPLQVNHESDEEIGMLGQNFDAALQTLKQMKGKSSHGKQHLYELPWYIIIGPPGSGKTTALINSGLEFPLSDRFGKNAIQGVGGTRNCDWWFTDQAVLLDTAGRYTTQDSHEAVDKAAWFGFLDLLKKHRPRRPVNGVLVAMSLSDLLRQTEEERTLHALAIRQRIQELNEQLGIRIPVYMLFTKTDLIAGFTDFFADFGQDERAQIWGVTFPEENEEHPADVVARVGQDFEDLLARLNSRMQKRLQEERDLQRRNLIFGFPQRMSLLKEPMFSFLQQCFGINRYQAPSLLRGVYFTSGTQEGTPIDRLMGILASTFKLDRFSAPVFSGKGKSYFLTRLLKEVIFGEAEIAGLNQRVEQRRSLMQKLSYGTAIALTIGMAALWSTSFTRNKLAIADVQAKSDLYEKTLADTPEWKSDFAALLKQMDALYAVRTVYSDDAPWSMQLGLYQGDKVRPLVDSAYGKQLSNRFLPLIKARLEQRLVSEEAKNPEILYELLRVYLMLGNPDKMDTRIFRPWIALDWENNYPQAVQQGLLVHLDNLLELPMEAQPLDEQLVAGTRQILTQIPVAQQVYMRIKREALQRHDYDFKLIDALGLSGNRVFSTARGTLEEQLVPGFFTYDGFYQIFLKESKDLAKQAVEQQWVLGEDNMAGVQDSADLEAKLRNYYFIDFIKRWDDLLNNLSIRATANIQQSIEVLEIVSGNDSPLRKLLQALDQQTSLTRVPAGAGALDKVKQGAEAAAGGDARMQKLLNAAKVAGVTGESAAGSGQEVERHFERLTAQIRNIGGAVAIDQVIADLGQLYGYMADLGSTSDTSAAVNLALQRSSGGGNDIIAQINLHSARLPDPLKDWVRTLASGNWGIILGGAKAQLNRSLQSEVATVCKSALEGRYPLSKASRTDITLQDFGKFFAPNGVLDQFFNTHLKPFVDTSGMQWKLIAQDNQSIGLSLGVLSQFQNAAKIRDVFFQSGGQLPAISFELKPLQLDSNASRFWIDMGGQQTDYRHGPARATQFQWPGTGGGLVRYGFEKPDGKLVSRSEEGVWALFRVLDKADIQRSTQDSYIVTFAIEGLTAKYELRANSVFNPFAFDALKSFRCIAGI
ncbi:type VI secretion system membrane subunit TssM [Methylobacter sp. YRD-M1]|uniref:type VI secretion system membrane subunit TssM n=1 Tax=Methylobacter sp. YRD-M1 TaxID=2911520 RepID=UPI00227A05D3|nr:type VI secretion system membrane subunit TssM [Methylobacter sp. YRD-M1]WAK00364.1 type VI secretion system membrane subunit TssM [Methylobacter sp. YRD-M1]